MNAFYLFWILLALFPLGLLFTIGPPVNKSRMFYFIIGLVTSFISFAISKLIPFRSIFGFEGDVVETIIEVGSNSIFDEFLRFPAMIVSQIIAIKYLSKEKIASSENKADNKPLELKWTNIRDPHGMATYFGVGFGISESMVKYIIPTFLKFLQSSNLQNGVNFIEVSYSITSVIGHVGLTYIALIISVNRKFYQINLLLHFWAEMIIIFFQVVSPIYITSFLITIFVRFSIALIAYFILRPKVRYLSPAVLLFFQVVMFLGFVLLGTFILLLVWVIGELARIFIY